MNLTWPVAFWIAVLAAVVVAYSVGLIKPAEFLHIRRVRRIEFRWALIALAWISVVVLVAFWSL